MARRRWRGCCTRRARASEDEFMKSGWIIAVALVLSLTACEKDGPATPAPIGDHAALEKLAKNYEAISEQLPVSPPNLQAKGRKEFVERVFAASGYQYAATLHRLAQGGWDVNAQNAKDLAQLVMLPHHDLPADQTLDGVYSPEELAAVHKLQAMMRGARRAARTRRDASNKMIKEPT